MRIHHIPNDSSFQAVETRQYGIKKAKLNLHLSASWPQGHGTSMIYKIVIMFLEIYETIMVLFSFM